MSCCFRRIEISTIKYAKHSPTGIRELVPCIRLYNEDFKDVRRELDEFRVNTHLCKLRCWYLVLVLCGWVFQMGGDYGMLYVYVLFLLHYMV